MTEHQQKADSLDREVADMEEQSERLKEQIADAREDWEAKRRDESIPGAPAPESGLPPEASSTTSGDEELPPPEPDETD